MDIIIVVQCIMERDMLKQRNIYREVYADKFAKYRQVAHSILLGLQGLRFVCPEFFHRSNRILTDFTRHIRHQVHLGIT